MNSVFQSTIRGLLLALTVASAMTVGAQIDTPRVAPEDDLGDLYARAAASRFVLIGTVTRNVGISKRLTKDLEARIRTEGNLSLMIGGALFTIEVEKTVCRQSDFKVPSPVSAGAPQYVYIFIPRDEPMFVEGDQRETLVAGQRYLLFLATPDQKILDDWIKTYELDLNQSYFRGQKLSRGVVPLKSPGLDIVQKLTRLCEAMRPAEVGQKIAALKKLEVSGDPVLEKEAREAAESLRTPKPN